MHSQYKDDINMRFIGNLFWILFGGGILGLLWALAGLLCCITIVGIPLGVQCFKFAGFVAWPFGRQIEYSSHTVDFIFNILWILLVGWELAVFSAVAGIMWCVTIVGIPFGIQLFKFSKLALMPFGARITTSM